MGRSDDSEEDRYYSSRKNIKKKKKRRERSRERSSSPESDGSRYSSSRHKKSKRKHDRYRSPVPDRRRRRRSRSRHRSRSADSYHRRSPSPSKSRSKYSRSRSRDRRSRSRDRRRRSRSRDRRSWSNSRPGSQRSSEERRSESKKSAAASPSMAAIRGLTLNETTLTPSQLAEERLRQALKAAAAADEKLRLQSSQAGESCQDFLGLRGVGDSGDFADRVKEIESDRFVAAAFSSSASAPRSNNRGAGEGMTEPSHDAAIFGSLSTEGFIIQPDAVPANVDWGTDSVMHPSLFCNVEDKMDRWIERLSQLRRRKLEGEAL